MISERMSDTTRPASLECKLGGVEHDDGTKRVRGRVKMETNRAELQKRLEEEDATGLRRGFYYRRMRDWGRRGDMGPFDGGCWPAAARAAGSHK